MADLVQFAVSCTPTETPTVDHGTGANIMATEVGQSLGGSGSAAVASYAPGQGSDAADGAYQGFMSGTQYYREAIDSTDTTDISAESSASFVFIGNTGYTYSTATALGDALTASVKVMVGTTLIAVLDAGEAIILKDDNAGIDCSGIHVRTVTTAGANDTEIGHLAVAFLVVD